MMRYNYVFIDNCEDYCRIARHDLESSPHVRTRTEITEKNGIFLFWLYKIHTSEKINNRLRLPFQSAWNKRIIGKLDFAEKKPICFVFAGAMRRAYQTKMFDYLRKTYPDCKIVLMLRDFVSVAKRNNRFFDPESARNIFDRIYTISSTEAKKFNFHLVPVMCSWYPVGTSDEDKKCDVVFIGRAKDRLDVVCRAYQKFTEAGLLCDFLVIGSVDKLTNIPDGVVISSKCVTYSEMLRRTVNARCILEVTQKGIGSMTSRFLEALCYNKKLISDNKDLTTTKFYNPAYIQLFEDVEDIDVSFVTRDEAVDYGYRDEYSPLRLLEHIDQDLLSLNEKGKEK